MRHTVIGSILLLFLPMTLYAETKYVSEIREITLRTGPGVEYKITDMIKSATPMTVLENTEDWTQVRIDNGKEGWVLSRFLQSKVPDGLVLKKLQNDYSALKDEADGLKTENQALKEKSENLAGELARYQSELTTLNTAHETLKDESADFIELQTKHKETVAELSAQKEINVQLENELTSVYNNKRLRWFMLGAGVLLIGIIIGVIFKPQRRRSVLR